MSSILQSQEITRSILNFSFQLCKNCQFSAVSLQSAVLNVVIVSYSVFMMNPYKNNSAITLYEVMELECIPYASLRIYSLKCIREGISQQLWLWIVCDLYNVPNSKLKAQNCIIFIRKILEYKSNCSFISRAHNYNNTFNLNANHSFIFRM